MERPADGEVIEALETLALKPEKLVQGIVEEAADTGAAQARPLASR